MRRLLAISLSIILFASCCKDVGTYVSFYANQDFIAKVFCVNKDDPKSCCAGKCYLTKELAKGKTDKDNPTPVNQGEIKQLQYIPVATELFTASHVGDIYFHNYYYRGFLEVQVLDDLLRPPITL